MNILFLTIAWPQRQEEHNLYTDLLECFVEHGHNVVVVCSSERRFGKDTHLAEERGLKVLYVRTGNLTKVSFVEKGISNLLLGTQFKKAIKSYFAYDAFDLILMSTPPITLSGVYAYLKKEYNAKTYLLLKDIWPQGIADVEAIKQNGLIYKYFSYQEQRLYASSDYIGCMSPANIQYIKLHNHIPKATIVEENPNSIRIRKLSVQKRREIFAKYNIPTDKCIFIAGGNFGVPQGITQFLSMLEHIDLTGSFFLFIGDGTEAGKIRKYVSDHPHMPVSFIPRMLKDEYEQVCESADVGLILLDGRYTIPNFPSRLLSYLENHLPVLCCTDSCTDIGKIVEMYNCGRSVIQGDIHTLSDVVRNFSENEYLRIKMGNSSYDLLRKQYSVEISYEIIMRHFRENNCVVRDE